MDAVILKNFRAFTALEEELASVAPEDVSNMGWAPAPDVNAYFVGEAPFHVRALALLHHRALATFEALERKVEEQPPQSQEEFRSFLDEKARQKRKLEALANILSWVIETEFPPPARTERRKPICVGVDSRGQVYYEVVLISPRDETDIRPAERRHTVH